MTFFINLYSLLVGVPYIALCVIWMMNVKKKSHLENKAFYRKLIFLLSFTPFLMTIPAAINGMIYGISFLTPKKDYGLEALYVYYLLIFYIFWYIFIPCVVYQIVYWKWSKKQNKKKDE